MGWWCICRRQFFACFSFCLFYVSIETVIICVLQNHVFRFPTKKLGVFWLVLERRKKHLRLFCKISKIRFKKIHFSRDSLKYVFFQMKRKILMSEDSFASYNISSHRDCKVLEENKIWFWNIATKIICVVSEKKMNTEDDGVPLNYPLNELPLFNLSTFLCATRFLLTW